MIFGEISLLGQPANKSYACKIYDPGDEYLTVPAKYFVRNVKSFIRKNKSVFIIFWE